MLFVLYLSLYAVGQVRRICTMVAYVLLCMHITTNLSSHTKFTSRPTFCWFPIRPSWGSNGISSCLKQGPLPHSTHLSVDVH
jgi:hypothetical protein